MQFHGSPLGRDYPCIRTQAHLDAHLATVRAWKEGATHLCSLFLLLLSELN